MIWDDHPHPWQPSPEEYYFSALLTGAVEMFDSILPCRPSELGLRIVKTGMLCDAGLSNWDEQWIERRLDTFVANLTEMELDDKTGGKGKRRRSPRSEDFIIIHRFGRE